MNLGIQNLVVNASNNSPDLLCGFLGAIFGGFISGGITWLAMNHIDKKNKERWQKDSFQKRKNDLIIDSLIKLGSCLNLIKQNNWTELKRDNSFNFQSYEYSGKYFEDCSRDLSKLSIFYNEKSSFYEKIKEVKHLSYLIGYIFYQVNAIKENNVIEEFENRVNQFDNEQSEEEKKFGKIFNKGNKTFDVFIIKFVEFICSQSTLYIQGHQYAVELIPEKYNKNFDMLIKDFYKTADEFYYELKNQCEFE